MLDPFYPGKLCFELQRWFFATVSNKIPYLAHILSLPEATRLHTGKLDVPLWFHFLAQRLREAFHTPLRRIIYAAHRNAIHPAQSAIDTLHTASVQATHPI